MKTLVTARDVDSGVEPTHTIEVICANCEYDLDESEISADTCADCGQPLNLKQSVTLAITSLPPIFGDAT
jgi:predicted amidophosphoribosyltransferase